MILRFLAACCLAALAPTSGAFAQELPTPASAAAADPAPYRIARGDELNLKFFYTPELNTIATVRSDGRIGIPLVGDLRVEGLSLAELSGTITERLASQVRRPEVSINVQGASSQRVFIGGEVTRAGVQPLVGPLSVAQAVMVAEGLKDTARAGDVVLLRRGKGDERVVMHLNLAAALDGSDTTQDVALQPYDVLVVPKSGIANVNLWIDQYLRRNIPISLGINYSVNGGVLYK